MASKKKKSPKKKSPKKKATKRRPRVLPHLHLEIKISELARIQDGRVYTVGVKGGGSIEATSEAQARERVKRDLKKLL